MATAITLFLVGLCALLLGAKALVSGASQLAKRCGISSLVIGLTIVSFGTSAPEIAIGLVAAWKGEGALVVGDVVGSNIFNVLFVLGIAALLTPLVVQRQLIRWDVPLMIGATLLFWLVSANRQIGRLEGVLLFAGILFYLLFTFVMLRKQPPQEEKARARLPIWLQIMLIIIGLALLSYGSELLVINATYIAHYFGISELLIGLTVVAVGTSLPELATTLVAVYKGERDLAVGNIVGSNLFNLLAVVGVAGMLSPTPIAVPEKAFVFDIPVLVGVSIAMLPIFLTGHRISRWEGALFLLYYVLYMAFLFIEAHYPPALPYFTSALLFFIIPLTLLTLLIGVFRHLRK